MVWKKIREKFSSKPEQQNKVVLDRSRPFLIVSSDDFDKTEFSTVKETLREAKLITALPKVGTAFGLNAEYPEDFGDYQDYYDAYLYVPFLAQAVDSKRMLIFQNGFDTESKFKGHKQKADSFLADINADIILGEATLHALLTGNSYLEGERQGDIWSFKVLSSMQCLYAKGWEGFLKMPLKATTARRTAENVPELTRKETKGILHLAFNRLGPTRYGAGTVQRVLPTIKGVLYMEKHMPKIVRKRGDPTLIIKIDARSEEEFKKIKGQILQRKGAEDIFHDGTVEVEEVYKTTPRFGVKEILDHFRDNLIAGLGVPDIALGFGGTTTMATAMEQERLLLGQLHAYQRSIKRFIEQKLFPLAGITDVKVDWRPIKAEDIFALSKRYNEEIEHGVISPKYARQLLGYPPEAGEGAVMSQDLIPSFEKEPEGEETA